MMGNPSIRHVYIVGKEVETVGGSVLEFTVAELLRNITVGSKVRPLLRWFEGLIPT